MDRPDLSGLDPAVIAYIETLEQLLAERGDRRDSAPAEPSEPPTTVNIISISAHGFAKRTPRHLYLRQRRGGMGVFDLDCDEDDQPKYLVQADAEASIVVVTDRARAFRIPVAQIGETDVRGRGVSLHEFAALNPSERIAVIFAESGASHLVLVTERGQVRRISAHYFGNSLRPGTVLYDTKDGGAPAAVCWSSGGADLFILTRSGKAIRFAERQVPVRGCLGIRLDPGDAIAGVTGTAEEDAVFLLTSDGKGTIRLMNGFSANKAPGSGGKVAIKADAVVGVAGIHMNSIEQCDLFVISELGKIIRFQAAEVPPKEGVVQGVNCMNLRADVCTALVSAVVDG